MRLFLLFALLAVAYSFKVEKLMKIGKSYAEEYKDKATHLKDKALSIFYGNQYKNELENPGEENVTKKPKCNLEYLACVKRGGGTRKAHLKCGKKFLKCKAKCYKKCKHEAKLCMKYHPKMMCWGFYKKCAHKCPHISKCAKKCKAIFVKCKKSKGKDCLKTFIECVKKCKKDGKDEKQITQVNM